MNKKMLTTMLVMLIAATAVTAQAGNYDIYGYLHTSLDALNNGDTTELFLASNDSRFGVKGMQEMNENFTFIWQFESEIDIANRSDAWEATLANRNTFLGLKGDWGTFKAGIHDSPFYTLGRKADFFVDELGDLRQTTFNWDRRFDKALIYSTPDLNGFGITAAYQLKNDVYMADTGALSASAAYQNDTFFLGAAYEMIQKNNYYVAPSGHWEPTSYGNDWVEDPGFTNPEDAIGLRFVGRYTSGDLELAGMFQTLQNRDGHQYTLDNVVGDLTSITWGGGFCYTMSESYKLKSQFYAFDPNTDVDDDDAAMFALGIDHTYAPDMTFYVQFAMMNNSDFTAYPIGAAPHGAMMDPYDDGDPTNSTEDPYGFSVGMIKTW